MSMQNAAARLAGLAQGLSNEWRRTKTIWSDSRSEAFAETYMVELRDNVGRALATIDEIDRLLRRIRTDCE